MRSRWLQLPLFSQLSSPATREFTRRLHRFGYSFDHVADRGHLRRVLEEVNYARRKTVIHLQETVERNDCELQITDFPRYDSTEPPLQFSSTDFFGRKIEISKGKGRGYSKIEKQLLRKTKDNERLEKFEMINIK